MDQLRAALRGRLDELAAARPDLGRAVSLQRALLSRQLDLLEVIRNGGVPGLALPPGYLAAKLGRGVPALHGEPVPLPARLLETSAREFCDHLGHGGASDTATAVANALDARTLDPGALLSACFGRDQRRVRFMASQHALSPDIAWLVAELALAPFVYLLQSRIAFGSADWNRGYCPCCGSWPAVIEAVAGAHVLRCSFCAASWQLSTYRCLYCGNDAETFITAADPEQPRRRVQLCGGCGGYVKVIEIDAPTPFPLLAVEDLATMDLDLVAIEQKYLRPALPDIGRHRT